MPAPQPLIRSGPFHAWLQAKLARYMVEIPPAQGAEENRYQPPAHEMLAAHLGVSPRTLNRYLRGARSVGKPANEVIDGQFPLGSVEAMLDNMGVRLAEVYPEFDVPLEPEAWCAKCEDVVTTINGACAWCDSDVIPMLRRSA